jgi:hypothetical protein
MKISIDDLRQMNVSALARLACSFNSSQADWFWQLTGMICATLPEDHPAIQKLWDCAHIEPADFDRAQRICFALALGLIPELDDPKG